METLTPPQRTFTWRSILLGLLGVGFICGLTPYNDYAVNNTYLVGNYLPVGLLAFFLVLILLVNAPLHWAEGRRQRAVGRTGLPTAYRLLPTPLGGPELAVAFGMVLVSCAVPSSGLMRYLPSSLVMMLYHGGATPQMGELLEQLDPPEWIFPSVRGTEPAQRAIDPAVTYFHTRWPVHQETFLERWRAVPWGAWLRPALTWTPLILAVWGAVLCLAVIVRRQWVDNERLAFPLASVYLALLEPPEPGRALNSLLGSRMFWIAFATVFSIHSINAMHLYWPRYMPEIPVSYDLTDLFSDAPWVYTEPQFKGQVIYFSVIGITFFLQTKVAFSLWITFLLYQVARMNYGTYHADITPGMRTDQLYGAVLAFALWVLWTGRQQWMLILRRMLGRAGPGEPQGRYLPYGAAGWGLVLCSAVIVVWLMLIGATFIGAMVVVIMALTMYLVVARVVAETGLIFVQIPLPIHRPWTFAMDALPGTIRTPPQSFFASTLFHTVFTHDLRETLPVYATNALRISDQAAFREEAGWRRAIGFTGLLLMALVAGGAIAGASTLYVNYSYAATLDESQTAPINPYGMDSAPMNQILNPTLNYARERTSPTEAHNRIGHFTFGAGLTGLLGYLRIRFAGWPLYPVGFLLVYSWALRTIWFSICLGWLMKVLITRLGGAKLFMSSRPLFVGAILGEAGAAGAWLLVSLVLSAMGMEYHAVRLLPI